MLCFEWLYTFLHPSQQGFNVSLTRVSLTHFHGGCSACWWDKIHPSIWESTVRNRNDFSFRSEKINRAGTWFWCDWMLSGQALHWGLINWDTPTVLLIVTSEREIQIINHLSDLGLTVRQRTEKQTSLSTNRFSTSAQGDFWSSYPASRGKILITLRTLCAEFLNKIIRYISRRLDFITWKIF